jgi:purine-binding chemotaxis protein CheW
VESTPLERALADAPDRPAPAARVEDDEHFLFRLGTMTLGVRSSAVREVTRRGPLTPLPRAPAFVLGVIGHRGEVFPLLDLLRFLGQGEARTRAQGRVFVCAVGSSVVGFAVDEVIGLRRVARAEVLPAPTAGPRAEQLLTGLATLPGLGTVTLLDAERVVAAARQRVLAR